MLRSLSLVLVCCLLLRLPVDSIRAGELQLRDGSKIADAELRFRGGTFRAAGKMLPREKVRSLRFVEGRALASAKAEGNGGMDPKALRELASHATSWKDVDGVILLDESHHVLKADGARTSRHRFVAHVLKDERKSWGRKTIWFEPGRDRVRIVVAHCVNPDGSHHVLDPKDVKISVPSSSGFTHFQKAYEAASFVIPGVEKGSVVEIVWEHDVYRPSTPEFFFPSFGFQSSVPVRKARFVVEGPEDLKLRWKTRFMAEGTSDPKIAVQDGRRSWTWTMTDVEPMISEPSMPSYWDVAPSVRCSNLSDWKPFFAWARKMIEGKVEDTAVIRSKAAEICKGASSELERIATLYHWMQREIRYISVKSSTSSGYAGHRASLTLEKKFGDCIDKAILFASLLRAVGVKARPVIVNTNSSFTIDPDLPGWQSNHAITQIEREGATTYLDTTATSYRHPSFRRDDQGVLCFNLDEGRFDAISLPPPEAHVFGMDMDLELVGEGDGKVEARYRLFGAYEASHRSYWKGIKEEERKKVMERTVGGLSPGARLERFAVENEYDLAKPLKVSYACTLPSYVSEAGPLRILELPKARRSFPEAGLPTRRYPIEYRSTHRDEVTIRLRWDPETHALHHVPSPLRLSTVWADFEAGFESRGAGALDYRQCFRLKKRIVPVDAYPAYRRFLTQVARYTQERVFLARKEAKVHRDLLVLDDGREIKGALQEIRPKDLLFDSEDGTTVEAPLSNVVRLDLGESHGGGSRRLEELDDDRLKKLVASAPGAGAYPGAGSITLLETVHVELRKDGSSTETRRWVEKVLKERGKGAGNYSGSYRKELERLDIVHGRTLAADGRVHVLADDSIQESSRFPSYPAYDVSRSIKFALPEVNPGAITDIQVRHTVRSHDLFHPFFHEFRFQGAEPLLEKEVTIEVPEDAALVWKILNGGDGLRVAEKVEGGRRILRVALRNVKARRSENYCPPTRDYLPGLVVGIHRPWEEVARAWASEARKVLAEPWETPPALEKVMADEAMPGRIEAIYDWVARNLALAAVGMGSVGWRPRAPGAILSSRYGNYLDKTFLFWALLNRARIPAEFHLLCDQNEGRLVENLGTLAQFNDALIRLGASKRFVNPERSYAPIDTLYEDFQGCRSLTVLGGKGERCTVPLRSCDEEETRTEQTVKIRADGGIRVERITRPRGNGQYGFRRLKGLKAIELRKRLQRTIHAIHPKGRLESYRYENLDRLEIPLELGLVYSVEDYCLRAGEGTLALRLPGLDYSASSVGKEERLHPLYWWTRIASRQRIAVELPEGWFVRHLPEPLSFEDPAFRYEGRFRREGKGLVFEGRYERRVRSLPKEAWPRYRKLLQTRARASKAWIVIERFD